MWLAGALLALGVALAAANAPLRNLCSRDGRPLLFGGLEGGLNNQKWLLHVYLATARKYQLTWALPRLHMEYFNECNGAVGQRHLSYLYNLETLLNFTATHGISLMLDAPKGVEDHCCKATLAKYARTRAIDVPAWRQQYPDSGICVHSFPMFYGQPNDVGDNVKTDGTSEQNALFHLRWDQGDLYRTALQPSGHLVDKVHHVMRYLVEQYVEEGEARDSAGRELVGPYSYLSWRRQWPVSYTAVHLRIEDDWQPHCKRFVGRSGTNGHGMIKCWYTEDMVLRYLGEEAKAPKGGLLQIASGEPLAKLGKLCSAYRCFKVADIMDNAGWADFNACITREQYAAVEFWVATYASAFHGNVHSSFTVELLSHFRMLGKPAQQYNTECSSLDAPDCQ